MLLLLEYKGVNTLWMIRCWVDRVDDNGSEGVTVGHSANMIQGAIIRGYHSASLS